jgi:hypothetical protein
MTQSAIPIVRSVEGQSTRHSHATRGSTTRQLTFIIATLIEVAIIVLAMELTLGIGFEGDRGSMPAPAPMRGF